MSANAKIAVLAPSIRNLTEAKERLEAIGVVVIIAYPAEVKFDVVLEEQPKW